MATIDRFYSASFAESVEAIRRLGEENPLGASYAAASGAGHARNGGRLDDMLGYLDLAQGYASGQERIRYLVEMGNGFLARGARWRAFRSYRHAWAVGPGERTGAGAAQRLARVALAAGRPRLAVRLLESSSGRLEERHRFQANLDLAVARELLGDPAGSRAVLRATETSQLKGEESAARARTELRLLVLQNATDAGECCHDCASSVVFSGDSIGDLAMLVETTVLLQLGCPTCVDPMLVEEAGRAAERLGNDEAEVRLRTSANAPRTRLPIYVAS
jgi:hypothetical protein